MSDQNEITKKSQYSEIYPLAFTLNPGITLTLYHVGFPKEWKNELFEIARTNPYFRDHYGLYTNPLKKYFETFIDPVIDIRPLKYDQDQSHDDSQWLTSFRKLTKEELQDICNLIRIWIESSFGNDSRISEEGRIKAFQLAEHLDDKDLLCLQSEAQIELTKSDGTVDDKAYDVIPYLVVNNLLGKHVVLKHKTITLSSAERNTLISNPLTDEKSKHQFSYVFNFSVQTIPPNRHALLICHMSIRRWVYEAINPDHEPFERQAIMAHIKVGKFKHSLIPILCKFVKNKSNSLDKGNWARLVYWDQQYEKCFNLLNHAPLPSAKDVLKNPKNFRDLVLLPYSVNMKSMKSSVIGTGVSMYDKTFLIQELSKLIMQIEIQAEEGFQSLIQKEPVIARRIGNKERNIKTIKVDQSNFDSQKFSKWVSQCIEASVVHFELYGQLDRKRDNHILQYAESLLYTYFEKNGHSSDLTIDIQMFDSSPFINLRKQQNEKEKILFENHSKFVQRQLGSAKEVTAALFLIPDPESFKGDKQLDPKNAIRNGFARSGRVIQFIDSSILEEEEREYREGIEKAKNNKIKLEAEIERAPEEYENLIRKIQNAQEAIKKAEAAHGMYQRIHSAIRDLFRGLGVYYFPDLDKLSKNPMVKPLYVGLHLITEVAGHTKNGKNLPIFLKMDLETGKTRVCCNAFDEKEVNYREACQQIANLYWNRNLKDICDHTNKSPVKGLLIPLQNQYDKDSNGVLVLTSADVNIRRIWAGITDKEIQNYEVESQYCPLSINIGMQGNDIPHKFLNTGVRIIRVRVNNEVPDYYVPKKASTSTSLEQEYEGATVSGIFKYEQVFWAIESRPFDPRYTKSLKQSKIDHPREFYAEKDMIELYPLQLQPDDNAKTWICYADNLRNLSIQVPNTNTILPLPLHLLKCLMEYLFDPND